MRGRETSQACELAEIILGEHLQVCFFLKKRNEKGKKEGKKEGRKGKDLKKKVEWV